MQPLAVGVDVVPGDRIQRIGVAMPGIVDGGFAGHKSRRGRSLRAQHHVVNLALTRGKVAIDRHGAGDIRGVHAAFAGRIHHHDVSIGQRSRVVGVVQGGRIDARADDRRVRGPLASLGHQLSQNLAGNGALGHAGSGGLHHDPLRGH